MEDIHCRFCKAPLHHTFVDLGMSPLSNAYLRRDQLNGMEPFYPLLARVCERCFLVQLEQFELPEKIFTDYAYFSSFAETWLRHCREYAERTTTRFGLNAESRVVEIASNDGYLLQFFLAKGIPVLGIEPAQNVAEVAEQKGIRTIAKFFGARTAQELVASGEQPDLLVANNVLAHVPDLSDFVAGMKLLLKPHGIITVEFPHILRLIESVQFDTIYHEHFSYFSFSTVETIFAAQGFKVFDVEELSTHGGSLRIYACHAGDGSRPCEAGVAHLREREIAAGIRRLQLYSDFADKARATKRALLRFLIDAKESGKTVVGYGAPAKATTLLNYCGVGTDLVDYTVDASPHKQEHFIPGKHIPIYHPDMIRRTRPDYVLIFPWNLQNEIMEQMADVRQWGGQFVIPIPNAKVLE